MTPGAQIWEFYSRMQSNFGFLMFVIPIDMIRRRVELRRPSFGGTLVSRVSAARFLAQGIGSPATCRRWSNGAALRFLPSFPAERCLFEQFLERARRGEYDDWPDKPEVARRMKRKLRARLFRLFGRTPKAAQGRPDQFAEHLCVRPNVQPVDRSLGEISSRRSVGTAMTCASSMWRPIVAAGDDPRFRLLRSV